MESIIKIEDLTFTYPGSDEAVLKGGTLTVPPASASFIKIR